MLIRIFMLQIMYLFRNPNYMMKHSQHSFTLHFRKKRRMLVFMYTSSSLCIILSFLMYACKEWIQLFCDVFGIHKLKGNYQCSTLSILEWSQINWETQWLHLYNGARTPTAATTTAIWYCLRCGIISPHALTLLCCRLKPGWMYAQSYSGWCLMFVLSF